MDFWRTFSPLNTIFEALHDFRRDLDCLIRIDKKEVTSGELEGKIIFVPEFGFSISAFST